jgi:hypothetical protein
VTRLRAGELGKRPEVMFCKLFRLTQWSTQPLFSLYWVLLHQEESGWAMKLAFHPPYTSKIKNEWSYTFPPTYAFIVWRGGNFILYILNFFCVKVV